MQNVQSAWKTVHPSYFKPFLTKWQQNNFAPSEKQKSLTTRLLSGKYSLFRIENVTDTFCYYCSSYQRLLPPGGGLFFQLHTDTKYYIMCTEGVLLIPGAAARPVQVLTLPAFSSPQDFLIMFLHHVAAISLITFSYVNNMARVGTLVMCLHDAADVLIEVRGEWFGHAGWGAAAQISIFHHSPAHSDGYTCVA